MAGARSARWREAETQDYWPGFVDALATLLLVIIFLLAVFTVGQFALSQALSGRDEQLANLNARLATLADELGLAQAENARLSDQVASLSSANADLQASLAETSAALASERERAAGLQRRLSNVQAALQEERALSADAEAAAAALQAQLETLQQELASLNETLNAAEAREAKLESEIVNLGERLNAALASEAARLSRYRSDFFGRLVEILGDRSGVRVVGDRFVFETDVLFASGSAELSNAGREALRPIAAAIIQLDEEIPTDIDWVVRVDGHTDVRPVGPASPFTDNWELSTARSRSVIGWFEQLDVPPARLMAAGFGEHYPIAEGESPEALARNRRIELKLTAR